MPNYLVPGAVPYAPGQLSPAPQTNLGIAEMMLQQSNRQADASRSMWNNFGQSVAGIGTSISEGLRQERLQKQADLDNQVKMAQLHELQNSQDAKKVLGEAFASNSSEDGTTDFAGVKNYLVSKGHPEMVTPALKQSLDTNQAIRDMHATQFQDQVKVGDYWATVGKNLKERMTTDPDGGIGALGHLIQVTNLKTPFGQAPEMKTAMQDFADASQAYQKAQQLDQQTGQAGHTQAVVQAFRQKYGALADQLTVGASEGLRKQWAEESKPVSVAPGASLVNPQTGAAIYTAPEKQPTLLEQQKFEEEKRHNRVVEGQKQYEMTGGMGMTGSGAPQAPAAGQSATTGDEFLKGLDPQIASQVKAYAEGRMPIPSGFALKSPYFQNMMRLVGQYDPTFDAAQYPQRVAARRDFIGGGRAAQTINAMNTVVGHLSELAGDAQKTSSSSFPLVNAVVNAAKTATGSPDVTNFMTRADGIANELMRVYRQTGAGSTKDIEEWRSHLNPNMSPEQKRGALATAAQMLEDKMAALENQKNQALGKAGEAIQVVTPESRARLDALTGQKPASASISPTAPVKYQGRVVTFSQLPPDVQQKILAAQGQ